MSTKESSLIHARIHIYRVEFADVLRGRSGPSSTGYTVVAHDVEEAISKARQARRRDDPGSDIAPTRIVTVDLLASADYC